MAIARILTMAALLAGLAAPATAQAAQRSAGSHKVPARKVVSSATAANPLVVAAAAGRQHWGAVPCNGNVKVVARRPLAVGVAPDADAWVTFDSALGKNNVAAAASTYTNCVITLARWRWPTTASMIEDWDLLCSTMVHEQGHLLGRSHDMSPGSVMAPVFTEGYTVPSVCRTMRLRRAAR